jgi:hypothetical protein
MRSTFKAEYEKETLPDDAVKLTFREGPIDAHQAALFTAVAMGYPSQRTAYSRLRPTQTQSNLDRYIYQLIIAVAIAYR